MATFLKVLAWITLIVGIWAPIGATIFHDPSGYPVGAACLGTSLTLFVTAKFMSLLERIAVGIETVQAAMIPTQPPVEEVPAIPTSRVESGQPSDSPVSEALWGRHPF